MAVRLSVLRAGSPLTPGRFLVLISLRGWVDPRAVVRLEGLGQLKISNDLIGNWNFDLPACSIVPQLTTLPRAPEPCYRIFVMRRMVWVVQKASLNIGRTCFGEILLFSHVLCVVHQVTRALVVPLLVPLFPTLFLKSFLLFHSFPSIFPPSVVPRCCRFHDEVFLRTFHFIITPLAYLILCSWQSVVKYEILYLKLPLRKLFLFLFPQGQAVA
jgi:hypothetical protein